MNDRAREALVAAALSGIPQTRGEYYNHHGGRCAMGVLLDVVDYWNGPLMAQMDARECLYKNFAIGAREHEQIRVANDSKGWDFLTIARKIGVTDGEE
jgi:hypothetical protein